MQDKHNCTMTRDKDVTLSPYSISKMKIQEPEDEMIEQEIKIFDNNSQLARMITPVAI